MSIFRSLPTRLDRCAQVKDRGIIRLFGVLGERIHSWLCSTVQYLRAGCRRERHSTHTPPPRHHGLERVTTSSLIRSKYEIPRTTNGMFWLASQYESYGAVNDDTLVQGGLHNLAKMMVGGRCSDAASKRGFRHLLPEWVWRNGIYIFDKWYFFIHWYKYVNVST